MNNSTNNQSNNNSNYENSKEFKDMLNKQRRVLKDEEKRIEEQEKRILANEKKEEAKQKRVEEERKKEEAELEKEDLEVNKKKKKIYVNKRKEMELKAKKIVLDEQFKSNESSTTANRFKKPLQFQYTAKSKDGKIEKSIIEAYSRADVYSFLKSEGYDIYDITVAKAINIQIGSYKIKRSRLIFYLSQLSAYLKSGIALADAVKILDNQSKNINEKKVWRAVYYDLSMGDNLSSALEKRGNSFPRLLINMIKTAEMTGNLDETLDDMVNYYTETEQTARQMKSAMTYPIVVSVFAIAVVTFIILYVVPKFTGIYKDLGSELPGITKVIIAISNFLQKYIIIIAAVLVVLIILLVCLYKYFKPVKMAMQKIAMHIPVFGSIIIYNEVNVFTKTFANLINHNVFITDSIDVLSKVTNNEVYKKLIFKTAKNLTKGESISSSFKDHWAFPNIAYQMLLTGEKTGRLGSMMEKVSEYYEDQHRTLINQMKSLIEPMLIIFLAVIVGFILVSVIVPMFGIYEGLQ